MANNNIQLSTLVLGVTPIPIGGDGVFAEFTPDPRYTTSDGVSRRIYNKTGHAHGTLVVTCFPQDPAAAILRKLVQADNVAVGQIPLPGLMVTSNGETVTWTGGRITEEAGVRIEQESQTLSITVAIDGYKVAQVPGL